MHPRRPARMLSALAVLALSAALAACGTSESKSEIREGVPVELGELQYNVLFSRLLNPNDVEDRQYLIGQPPPAPDQLYLGVFVQILNKDKEDAQPIPTDLVVTDSEHNEYHPLPTESPYALRLGDSIGPDDQVPALDSAPQVGPIEGSLVLYVLPDEVTEDRPLELTIPGKGGPATVELDV
ncbi:MAG: hypothetical protein ACRDKV_01080 [Solirubrobacterales bacterium]